MKKYLFIIIAVLLATSCSKKAEIVVYNNLNFDRSNEMVEVCLCNMADKIGYMEGSEIVVYDEDGNQIPCQLLNDKKTIIFPASVKAKDSSVYIIKTGDADSIPPKTFGRKVPERKDDVAWENDRVAFRMYGPALKKEGASNGVDIWHKRTEELIINKFYKDELINGKSYHIDHGQGLDCYKVGNTLGGGGVAPYLRDKLWIGHSYDKIEILENGALRTVLKLIYDSILVDTEYIQAKVFISLNAGSQLNRAAVSYSKAKDGMQIAAGIYLHDSIGKVSVDTNKNYITYAENAISDAGIPSGKRYVALIMPTMLLAKQSEAHVIGISNYSEGLTFVYYFGAGWSKWGFPTDDSWNSYIAKEAEKIKHPLVVKVK